MRIAAAALSAVDPARLVGRALDASALAALPSADVVAAGKAAGGMIAALAACGRPRVGRALIVGGRAPDALADRAAVHPGAHPVPDDRSVEAGRAALALAAAPREGGLIVLLSGGASAMLAVPVHGVPLAAKRAATGALLAAGVDIHALNCVRKHLSLIKGGRLAAAAATPVVTLAISDVAGDDPAVIGSGPTVADPTTYGEALAVLDRAGGRGRYPGTVVAHLERGARGGIDETPKPGDPRLRHARTIVIGSAADALSGARRTAEALGYTVVVRAAPVTGEARTAAAAHAADLAASAAQASVPLCLLSAGETTVTVTGRGRGGRNQEYALGAAAGLEALGRDAVLVSLGSDGVDGPTDAAGAIADSTTLRRARARGLEPMQYLDANDAGSFFEALGDLVRTGVTGTNVGDLQVALVAPPAPPERSEAP